MSQITPDQMTELQECFKTFDQEGKGNGHLALMASIPHKKAGMKQSEAYQKVGFEADARSFRPAAEILSELKVKSVVLLTDNAKKAEDLQKWSINVSGTKNLNHE